MNRPLILWDIDDVLNDLTRICAEKVLPLRHAGVRWQDFRHNPPLDELHCSREEYVAQLDHCRENFTQEMMPQPEVLEFFQTNGNKFRSIALSAAPMTMAPLSAEWVLRYFGKWIQTVVFVPSPRPGYEMESAMFSNKAEAVEMLGGVLVDDAPGNIEPVRHAGGRALAFPAPWNENKNMDKKEFFTLLLKEIGC